MAAWVDAHKKRRRKKAGKAELLEAAQQKQEQRRALEGTVEGRVRECCAARSLALSVRATEVVGIWRGVAAKLIPCMARQVLVEEEGWKAAMARAGGQRVLDDPKRLSRCAPRPAATQRACSPRRC